MLRYSLATLVSVSLGMTAFAQTKAPKELPGLLSNNPGTVVSNSIPLATAKDSGIMPVSANVSQLIVPVGMVGHTTSCAEAASCDPCPAPAKHAKSRSSCFDCLKTWWGYKPAPTPCECGKEPTPYRPPLVAYFSCKGAPFVLGQPGCNTGCSNGVCAPNAPVGTAHPIPVGPAPTVLPAPTAPANVAPMNPTISSSYKGGPVQTGGYSSTTLGTGIKPLSLYAPGGVKTSSMQKSEVSPPLGQPNTVIPGYKRLGGTKNEPVTSTSLYPWK